jgi:hypothetical protein
VEVEVRRLIRSGFFNVTQETASNSLVTLALAKALWWGTTYLRHFFLGNSVSEQIIITGREQF